MSDRRHVWLAVLAVCAAAVIPYLPTIDDYFIRDDFGVVQLLAGKPAGYFPAWFYTSWMEHIWGYLPDEVRPFPAVSYQLTALGGAASPAAHHVLNIALHAANGLLVFATALLVMRLRLWCAALAGVIFVLLPSQAESVAWITGRVDSMPAFFYIASFLCYALWRDRGGWKLYATSVLLFFVALFSKQTTITMVATLVAYDVLSPALSERSESKGMRRFLFRGVAYLPYIGLTIAYLSLRLALFGEVVRESQLNAQGLRLFFTLADRHLARVVVGDPDGSRLLMWLLILLVVAVCVSAARRQRERAIGTLLFFGPVWWILGVAPVAVAGYESPRHVYLASMAWATLIALAFDTLDRSPASRTLPISRRVAAGAVIVTYAVLLTGAVREWSTLALVSQRAAQQLARQARVAPEGTLVVAGVPGQSWEWALPFAARPPFASTDLTTRTFIISPRELHCCRQQWFDDTREALRAWRSGPGSNSVVVLRVDQRAAAARLSSAEQPSLPDIARALLGVQDPDLLDQSIRRLLESL